MELKKTISSLILLIVLYWLYIHIILSLFHIVNLDLLVAMGSQPLDFYLICSFAYRPAGFKQPSHFLLRSQVSQFLCYASILL